MIEAERHGKRDLEDVVTSYVFGSLKYLPFHRGFGRLASLALGETRGPCELRLWPSRDGVEPDVVLATAQWTILVEAKTFSGFELTQLRREWRYLLQDAEQHGAGHRVALVTVTHDRYSSDELRGLIRAAEQPHLSREPSDDEVVALTWPELFEVLSRDSDDDAPETKALLADVEYILARRGLLEPAFSGWPVPSRTWNSDHLLRGGGLMADDAHQAYGSAFRFLKSYLVQAQRLLFDGVSHLQRAGYHMLRPNGERLVGNLDTLLRDPETWQPGWLACFFVERSIMAGASYGAPASKVDKVLFLELNLDASDESDENVPALWLGWVQDFKREGQVESQLQNFFWQIDYEKLPGTPAPLCAPASDPAWKVSVHDETRLGVALHRLPLRLVKSPIAVRVLLDGLVQASKGHKA